MKKLNYYLIFGVSINTFWLLSRRFFPLPDFIEGFCVGLGITLILWGLYIHGRNIRKVKDCKRKIFLRAKN